MDKLKHVKFLSVLMDESTDKGNADDELFMAVWCEHDSRIHTRTTFFHFERPKSVDSRGLFRNALGKLEIDLEVVAQSLLV